MTQPAPGPYRYEPDPVFSAVILDKDGHPVAEVFGDTHERMMANARLVRASWTMLQALRKVMDVAVIGPWMKDVVDAMRAAADDDREEQS